MIECKELNRFFETKEQMFKALREGHKEIISLKKAQILKAVEKGCSVRTKLLKDASIFKNIAFDDNYYYIVVNTTKVLDSHRDLHINGIWDKTAKERNKKNYLVDTHELSVKSTIARKEYVEILIAQIPFSSLGKDYRGNTEALIYKIPKDKIIDPKAKEWLDSGDDIEASVKMQYVQILFAMDSDDPEDEVFKIRFDEYITQIMNKDEFEDEYGPISYFWVVKEAKNKDESSLVLLGSNSATGNFKDKRKPHKSTSEHQPSNDTGKSVHNFYKHLN